MALTTAVPHERKDDNCVRNIDGFSLTNKHYAEKDTGGLRRVSVHRTHPDAEGRQVPFTILFDRPSGGAAG